jgi:hypothetical protein
MFTYYKDKLWLLGVKEQVGNSKLWIEIELKSSSILLVRQFGRTDGHVSVEMAA